MKFSIALLLAALAPAADAQSVISVHGSGTTNPSKCYWHIMDQIQTQTKLPVKMTYRAVGSSTGQTEFIGDVTTGTSDNDFGSGDIPLSQEDFDKFEAGSILHLPIVLGAISFFHSVPTGDENLNLTPCVLAKILNRDITDWTDAEIVELNPNLSLPSPYPISVARRVQGSSSTASITEYLHLTCSEQWPATLVGKEIAWKTDTKECEGSGGMTDCITSTPGTIGYIDSGHGHAEKLQEIELLNADLNYISSKEAAARGGIMAAAGNAGIPDSLDGSFADVKLLNQPGANTWPIVAISYVYIRKDLTYLSDPASQTLLKAFLKALYDDEYIPECEEEFGFFRVSGDLRDKALAAIDALVTSDGAPEWTFETDTAKRTGQGDYVISGKRQSYSEVEQDNVVDLTTKLETMIKELQAQNEKMATELAEVMEITHGHTDGDKGTPAVTDGEFAAATDGEIDGAEYFMDEQETQLKVALALSSISFIFWILAIIFMLVKFVLKI